MKFKLLLFIPNWIFRGNIQLGTKIHIIRSKNDRETWISFFFKIRRYKAHIRFYFSFWIEFKLLLFITILIFWVNIQLGTKIHIIRSKMIAKLELAFYLELKRYKEHIRFYIIVWFKFKLLLFITIWIFWVNIQLGTKIHIIRSKNDRETWISFFLRI